MRSGISVIECINQCCKFQARQVVHRAGGIDALDSFFDLLWIEQVAQIQFDGPATAAQEDMIPLSSLNKGPKFLDTTSAHCRARGPWRTKTVRSDLRQRVREYKRALVS